MLQRKGLSPLIATFLLIAFAIGLGVVVMSFGNTFYKADTPASCNGISLEPIKVTGRDEVCMAERNVRYMLMNRGADLNGIRMLMIGDSVMTTDLPKVGEGQVSQGNVDYNPSQYGQLRQIQFIPQVFDPATGQTMFCFDSLTTISSIRNC